MRNMINQEIIEGRLYDSQLALKQVQNTNSKFFGKSFMSGTVSIATDEAGLNVLDVHYTFIPEFNNKGSRDSRFDALKRIMETGKTWVKDGKDNALMMRINSAAALNDFFPEGQEEVVSRPRNESGFINFVSSLNFDENARNKFTFDTLITRVDLKEPENGDPYVQIRCAIFDFRKAILPFTLVARDPNAMNYFANLEVSAKEPVFTKVSGKITNTVQKIEKTVESAWGSSVEYSERTAREWEVTWAQPNPYVFDDPTTITAEEVAKALADRNVYLEAEKTRSKQYYASRNTAAAPSAPTPAPAAAIPEGGFDF